MDLRWLYDDFGDGRRPSRTTTAAKTFFIRVLASGCQKPYFSLGFLHRAMLHETFCAVVVVRECWLPKRFAI